MTNAVCQSTEIVIAEEWIPEVYYRRYMFNIHTVSKLDLGFKTDWSCIAFCKWTVLIDHYNYLLEDSFLEYQLMTYLI